MAVADALLDERLRADWVGYNAPQEFSPVIAVLRSIDSKVHCPTSPMPVPGQEIQVKGNLPKLI
jgi:hypothetical protein